MLDLNALSVDELAGVLSCCLAELMSRASLSEEWESACDNVAVDLIREAEERLGITVL